MVQASPNAVFYANTYHPIQAGSIDGTDTTPHDNAVHRALIASATGLYDPTGDTKAEGDPYCTIFVGRLSRTTKESTLHEAMSKYGRIKRLRIVRDIVTGASQGYAFVEFERDRDMLKAYEGAHMSCIDGRSVLVDYNRQQLMPGWIPRRLGGGFGGRKESGQLRFGGRERPFRAPLRAIPHAELEKLGIPLPPEGNYLARYQMPPPPRRAAGNLEDHSYRHRASAERPQVVSASRSDNKSGTLRDSRTVESGSEDRRSQRADYDDDRAIQVVLRGELRERDKGSKQASRMSGTGWNDHADDRNERDKKRRREEWHRESSRSRSKHREESSPYRHGSSRRSEYSSGDNARHQESRRRERDYR